ncbi:MAG: accessory factor UbiK family protein [Rhodospirillales bacterium]
MQTNNKLLDDLAKVAGGAASTLAGVRNEIKALVRQQAENLLSDMDLVPREEFEAMKAVALKARAEQEKLEKRVAALEAKLKATGTGKSGTAKTKPAKG